MSYWVILYRFGCGLMIMLVIFGVVCMFLPRVHELRAYQQRRVELERENRRIELATQDLADKQARFKTEPEFVERTAREAGMVKTNEYIYRLQ